MGNSELQRAELLRLAIAASQNCLQRQTILAGEYALTPPDAPLIDKSVWVLDDEEIEIAICRPEFCPPFEWLAEITFRDENHELSKHYLITHSQAVSAYKKELVSLDEPSLSKLVEKLKHLAAVS